MATKKSKNDLSTSVAEVAESTQTLSPPGAALPDTMFFDIDLEASFGVGHRGFGNNLLVRTDGEEFFDPLLWKAGQSAYRATQLIGSNLADEYLHFEHCLAIASRFLSIDAPEEMKKRLGDTYIKPTLPSALDEAPLIKAATLHIITLTQYRELLLPLYATTKEDKWRNDGNMSRASAGVLILLLINQALALYHPNHFLLYGAVNYLVGACERFCAPLELMRSISETGAKVTKALGSKKANDARYQGKREAIAKILAEWVKYEAGLNGAQPNKSEFARMWGGKIEYDIKGRKTTISDTTIYRNYLTPGSIEAYKASLNKA
jgi:hypothetical protein